MAAPLLVGAASSFAVGYDALDYKRTQEATEFGGRESLRERYPDEVALYEGNYDCLLDDTHPRLRFVMARPTEFKGGEWESMLIN